MGGFVLLKNVNRRDEFNLLYANQILERLTILRIIFSALAHFTPWNICIEATLKLEAFP